MSVKVAVLVAPTMGNQGKAEAKSLGDVTQCLGK